MFLWPSPCLQRSNSCWSPANWTPCARRGHSSWSFDSCWIPFGSFVQGQWLECLLDCSFHGCGELHSLTKLWTWWQIVLNDRSDHGKSSKISEDVVQTLDLSSLYTRREAADLLCCHYDPGHNCWCSFGSSRVIWESFGTRTKRSLWWICIFVIDGSCSGYLAVPTWPYLPSKTYRIGLPRSFNEPRCRELSLGQRPGAAVSVAYLPHVWWCLLASSLFDDFVDLFAYVCLLFLHMFSVFGSETLFTNTDSWNRRTKKGAKHQLL